MKDKFVRLGVSFARKHANRTKIWTSNRSEQNRSKILVEDLTGKVWTS